MATIGMLYICTGKYTVFWPEFYETFSRNFLPGCKKEYFVFTDAPSIAHEDDPAVHRIDQPAYDWPLSTMKRFAIFLTQKKALEQLDYLFFFNANLTCREVITPEEFLPRPQQGEQLLLVQQPGFWNKKPMFYSYDRNPRCTAYIPYNCGRDYVSGGLNGGTSAAFLAMCKELDRRTEQDIRNGVVPLWHDESQLNRYAAEHPGSYRLLPPTYWYPEGWQMPFDLALCDRCPCFGSLFPPLAALTFAASSIICAFGLASAAPRSPYRHLELCGIALAIRN